MFEEISFRGYPGQFKSVGRTAVVVAAAAETHQNNNSPGYPGWLNKAFSIREKYIWNTTCKPMATFAGPYIHGLVQYCSSSIAHSNALE